jgi:glycosyltransferase involved in cell wall biosynthesis
MQRPDWTAVNLAVSAYQLDSLPNALLEAHAAALPIVAYPSAGIPEIVQHCESGYLTKKKFIDELHQYCTQVLSNPAHAQQLGQRGRVHIQQHFNSTQQITHYIELLRA